MSRKDGVNMTPSHSENAEWFDW